LQDVSYNDAAVAVGCAVGTIRSRLHRARHLLSQKMGCAMASGRDDIGDRDAMARERDRLCGHANEISGKVT